LRFGLVEAEDPRVRVGLTIGQQSGLQGPSMNRPITWCSVALLFLAGGCVTTGPLDWVHNGFKVGPNYSKPPAPVAQEWIEARNAQVQARHIEDWWVVFQDDTLNSLIASSYRQNLNLRALATRVLQARAQQAIAVGNMFPQTQQATAGYTRTAISENAANNPSYTLQLFNFPGAPPLSSFPRPILPTNFYSDFSLGMNMSWELDLWGRIRRGVESSNANLDASVENFDDALVTLLSDVATNYVQYRVAQQRIRLARDNVKIQEDILALVERQFRVGINKVTRLDVEQARTVLEQTRSTIPALQIVQGQANDTLCVLLGFPPHDLERELGPGPDSGRHPIPGTPDWVAAGIPADLLRQRPDVRRAERQVAAQSAQIGVAEADLYPTLFVNGDLGVDAQHISTLFRSNSFFGTLGPGFRWNILNYGRILNNVRQQEAHTQELIATYQNQVLTAHREVQSSLRAFLRSRDQADALARSVTAAKGALDVGRQQYEAGTIPFNTVFNLATAQVQQQDQLAAAQGNVALNLIAVYRGLGGGWEIRLKQDHHEEAPVGPVPTPASAPAASDMLPLPLPVPPAKKE
jgi:NodT family efflux transporter outer membrane factor (OMF) lipoprotein